MLIWTGCAHLRAGLGPSCDHTGDISIQCEPPPRKLGATATDGQLSTYMPFHHATCLQVAVAMRLAGGDGNSGRLEISLNGPNGPWGTVCNGLFGDLSAAVVCRTMNKVAANKAPGIVIENTNNRFGELSRMLVLVHYHYGAAHRCNAHCPICCLQALRPATLQSGWLGLRALEMS